MTLPPTMTAIHLTAHGGPETLKIRHDVPVPTPAPGEVLIAVAAAGINNTDINTRTGWYSKTVTGDTASSEAADTDAIASGGWSGALAFPQIQGADVCGRIVAVGQGVDPARIGEHVLVQSMMRDASDPRPFRCITFGSERDGGFAQFATAPARATHAVDCDWTDAELASIPCAWSTAEGMLHRADVGAERVLITGASGGVGSAAIQLAKRRGAHVTALCSPSKSADVKAIGADTVLPRDADLVAALGEDSIDVVVDLVAGPGWPPLLDVLVRGGRYVVSGAIAGPIVELDVRTLYLKDLTLLGSTFQSDEVFANLIRYIERGEIRPLVAQTYPLAEIARAQADFMAKKFTGKLVLIPPPREATTET